MMMEIMMIMMRLTQKKQKIERFSRNRSGKLSLNGIFVDAVMINGADNNFNGQIKDQDDDDLVHCLLRRGKLVGSDF